MFTYRKQRNQLTERAPISAAEFLAGLVTTDTTQRIMLGVRAGVADAIGVPPEFVYPSDVFGDLLQLGFDGMDFIEVVVSIEHVLHVRFHAAELAAAINQLGAATMNFTVQDFAQSCARDWPTLTQPHT
jgi:hypothetical protein